MTTKILDDIIECFAGRVPGLIDKIQSQHRVPLAGEGDFLNSSIVIIIEGPMDAL